MDKKKLEQLFPGFEPALYDEIVQQGEVSEMPAGETLLKVGQTIRSTMLILDGIVKLYREDDEGKEFFIYHLGSGQACSLSMVCAARQETSEILAKTLTNVTLLSIPLEFMERWMNKYPGWYRFVVGSYRNRFEELLKTIDAIAFSKMDERLIYYLKQHQQNLQTNTIDTSITQIALDLNSSREVISRLMKKLSEKGLIRQHGALVEIVDLVAEDRD